MPGAFKAGVRCYLCNRVVAPNQAEKGTTGGSGMVPVYVCKDRVKCEATIAKRKAASR